MGLCEINRSFFRAGENSDAAKSALATLCFANSLPCACRYLSERVTTYGFRLYTRAQAAARYGAPTDPEGYLISREAHERGLGKWLPAEADRAYVHFLMKQVIEPGKMAGWIAPPERGTNNRPVDYEYVELH